MTFPLALAVGIEGVDEVMEVELAERYDAEELRQRLSPHAPPGLAFRTIEVLPDGTGKAQVRSASYEAEIPSPCDTALAGRIERLLAADSWVIDRVNRASIDLRPLLLELAIHEGVLRMRLRVDIHGSVGPRDVLAVLGLNDLEPQGFRLRRTAVEICA